jgi:hypothetical protein
MPATTTATAPAVVPATSGTAAPVPAATVVKPDDVIITIEEPGKPPQKCKVLKAWHTADGALAREVKDLDTGEILTLVDPVVQADMSQPTRFAGVHPHLQGVASRIFRWGRGSTPPPGAPLPPDVVMAEGPVMVQGPQLAAGPPSGPRPARAVGPVMVQGPQLAAGPCVSCPAGTPRETKVEPVPAPAVTSVAQPSDWRKSWGSVDDYPPPSNLRPSAATNSAVRGPILPLPTAGSSGVSKPTTTYNTTLLAQQTPPGVTTPPRSTMAKLPAAPYKVEMPPARNGLLSNLFPSRSVPKPDELHTGTEPKPPSKTEVTSVGVKPIPRPLPKPEVSPSVVSRPSSKSEPPETPASARQPAKVETAKAEALTSPPVSSVGREPPSAEPKNGDPLADPDRYSRRPLDFSARAPKKEEKPKPASPPAAAQTEKPKPASPPAAVQTEKPKPASPPAAPSPPLQNLPAGSQSVLAAMSGTPANVCYLPVPIVTLPSAYRPQPQEPRIPQPPRPVPPAPNVDPSAIDANAFAPAPEEVMPMPGSPISLPADTQNAFSTPKPRNLPPSTAPAAVPSYGQGGNAFAYPGVLPPGQKYGPVWASNPYQQVPAMAGMYPPGGQYPMARGMVPLNPYAAMQQPMLPPSPYVAPGYPAKPYATMPASYPPTPAMMPPGYPANPYGPVAPATYPAAPQAAAPPAVQPAAANTAGYASTAVTPAVYAPGAECGSVELRPANNTQDHLALASLLKDSLYPSQREWAAESLAGMDWKANPAVLQALLAGARDDPAPAVRATCIRCLARMKAVTPQVMAALQGLKTDTDPRVRQEVDQAMVSLGYSAPKPAALEEQKQ